VEIFFKSKEKLKKQVLVQDKRVALTLGSDIVSEEFKQD